MCADFISYDRMKKRTPDSRQRKFPQPGSEMPAAYTIRLVDNTATSLKRTNLGRRPRSEMRKTGEGYRYGIASYIYSDRRPHGTLWRDCEGAVTKRRRGNGLTSVSLQSAFSCFCGGGPRERGESWGLGYA